MPTSTDLMILYAEAQRSRNAAIEAMRCAQHAMDYAAQAKASADAMLAQLEPMIRKATETA